MNNVMEPNLSVGYILSRGLEAFKRRPGLVMVALLLCGLIGSPNLFIKDSSRIKFAVSILQILLAPPLAAGLCSLLINVVRDTEPDIGNLFDGFTRYGKSMAVYYMMAMAAIIGFVALIVPGIIVLTGLLPVMYLVLDRDDDAVETMQTAWNMTKGHKGAIFLIFCVLFLINIVGLLALIVGVFVTLSYSSVVEAVIYEELSTSYFDDSDR
jgi:uncharacterized membrane protein